MEEHTATFEAEITCPKCRHCQKRTLRNLVNVTTDPQLKLGILTDSLFMMTCKNCGNSFLINHELLYIDEKADLTILVAPDLEKLDLSSVRLEAKTSINRIVTSVIDLKEKIVIFDAGLDDRAIELSKAYITYRNTQIENLRFLMQDPGKELTFAISDTNHENQAIKLEYHFYEKLLKLTQNHAESDDYYLIDSNWAYNLFSELARKE
jgi:predicted nucleic-acid-binding Zn-ribbon protein